MQTHIEAFLKHLSVWIVLMIIPHVFFALPFSLELLCREFLLLIGVFSVFYIHAYVSMPYFFFKKRYFSYSVSLLFLAVLYVLLTELLFPFHEQFVNLVRELNPEIARQPRPPHCQPRFSMFWGLPPHLFLSFMATLCASGIFAAIRRTSRREKAIQDLEKQQITSNMQLLKSQLSPHFLFNAMNSLYSLSLKKSEKLPEVILTMSDLLRYATYDAMEDMVSIKKEIAYLNDYINLQKLRLSPDSKISFAVDNQNENAQIAPMIFVPFLENALKHGQDSNGAVDVDARIFVSASIIDFSIQNKKFPDAQKDKAHGIGINNVKTRLSLVYGSNARLHIDETADMYNVHLTIKL